MNRDSLSACGATRMSMNETRILFMNHSRFIHGHSRKKGKDNWNNLDDSFLCLRRRQEKNDREALSRRIRLNAWGGNICDSSKK